MIYNNSEFFTTRPQLFHIAFKLTVNGRFVWRHRLPFVTIRNRDGPYGNNGNFATPPPVELSSTSKYKTRPPLDELRYLRHFRNANDIIDAGGVVCIDGGENSAIAQGAGRFFVW